MPENSDDSKDGPESLSESELVSRICDPTESVGKDFEMELVRRSADDPTCLIDYLDELIVSCNDKSGESDTATAAAIGNVLMRHPIAAESHIEPLVQALNHDNQDVRECIASGLTWVVPEVKTPTKKLLSYLNRCDDLSTQAVEILAVIASQNPSRLDTDQLKAIATSDNEVSATGSRYLLVLLSSSDQCVPPYEPDFDGQSKLTQDLETLPQDQSLPLLIDHLLKTSIDEYLADRVADAGYHNMDLVIGPMGSQIDLKVESPSQITDPSGIGVDNLTADLNDQFGLDSVQLEIHQVSSKKRGSGNRVDGFEQNESSDGKYQGQGSKISQEDTTVSTDEGEVDQEMVELRETIDDARTAYERGNFDLATRMLEKGSDHLDKIIHLAEEYDGNLGSDIQTQSDRLESLESDLTTGRELNEVTDNLEDRLEDAEKLLAEGNPKEAYEKFEAIDNQIQSLLQQSHKNGTSDQIERTSSLRKWCADGKVRAKSETDLPD